MPTTWQDQTYCGRTKDKNWIIYLPAGTYLVSHIYAVSGSIPVPETVNEIAGVFSSVIRCLAGGTFADHLAERDLVLEDIYVEFNHVRDGLILDNAYVPQGGRSGFRCMGVLTQWGFRYPQV